MFEYTITESTVEPRRLAIAQVAATLAAGANIAMSTSAAVEAAFKIYDEAVLQDEARLEKAAEEQVGSEEAHDFRDSLNHEHGFDQPGDARDPGR